MAAPKGNEFWKLAVEPGRPPAFKTPEQMLAKVKEYFQWIVDNPLMEAKMIAYQGKGKLKDSPKLHAMTLTGMCLVLGISEKTWREYKKKEEFRSVIGYAEKVIYEQKFAGAAADLLNPNIIARDLGLKDKQQIEVNDITEVSDDDLREQVRKALAKLSSDELKDVEVSGKQ